MFSRRCVGLLLVILLAAGIVVAQILTGTLTGTVTDATGAVIPNAKITVVDTATNRTYTGASSSAGDFTFTNLSNGTYNVTIVAPGFAKFLATGIVINVSQVAKMTAKMQVASATTEVVVQVAQEVVQTENVPN